jgi:hypothetical protein
MKRKADTDLAVSTASSLVNNPKVRDVVFLVGDENEEMYALTHILTGHSSVFDAMFNGGFREGKEERAPIPIPNITPERFLQMLKYMYTGDADVTEDCIEALELWKMANQFQIEALCSLYEHVICETLSVDTLLAIAYFMADMTPRVRDAVARIVNANFNTFLEQRSFKGYEETSFENLVQILDNTDKKFQFLCLFGAHNKTLKWLDERISLLDVRGISKKATFFYGKSIRARKTVDSLTSAFTFYRRYIKDSHISPMASTWDDYIRYNKVLAVMTMPYDASKAILKSTPMSGFFWDGRPVSWHFEIKKKETHVSLSLRVHWEDALHGPLNVHGLQFGLFPTGNITTLSSSAILTVSGRGRINHKYMTLDEFDEYSRLYELVFYILRQ